MNPIQIKQMATVAGVSLLAIVLLVLFQPKYYPKVISWNPYSITEIHEDLDDGKVILVSVMASWSLDTVFHEARYSTNPVVLKLVRKNPISCYRVDLAKIPAEQFPYWRTYFDDQTNLGLLLLSKNSRGEFVLHSLPAYEITPEKVIAEIDLLLTAKGEPRVKRNTSSLL